MSNCFHQEDHESLVISCIQLKATLAWKSIFKTENLSTWLLFNSLNMEHTLATLRCLSGAPKVPHFSGDYTEVQLALEILFFGIKVWKGSDKQMFTYRNKKNKLQNSWEL